MKILFISESDLSGGASIAGYRLFCSLKKVQPDMKMLVKEKKSNDNDVVAVADNKLSSYWAKTKLYFEKLLLVSKIKNRKDLFYFSSGVYGWNISNHHLVKEADIIHVHWINHAFLSLLNLKQLVETGKVIIFHLHDMWPFTGGCNYAGSCTNFITNCGNCPMLHNSSENDLSRIINSKKQALYAQRKISFIASSVSLYSIGKTSSLLKNKKLVALPIPLDEKQFYTIDKPTARKKLGINSDKKIILFGVHNINEKRKGFQYFLEAINLVIKDKPLFAETAEIALFGKCNADIQQLFKNKVYMLGTLNATEILNAYNAADVYVLPSLEDNLPNTILESLSCKTPVVAFKTGGIPEMITHKVNGYLAEYKSAESLAEGMLWVLSQNLTATLNEMYRDKYVQEVYFSFYEELIASNN